jgi:hypothetical protein
MKRLLLGMILALGLATASAQGDEPPTQIESALADLSEQVGRTVPLRALDSYTWERVTYNSAALGCEQEDGFYAQVLVDGYTFTLDYDGLRYDYRVSENGDLVINCGEPQPIEADADGTEEITDQQPIDDDINPLVAIYPASGSAGSFVQVIANDLPENTRVEVGLSLAGDDYPTVDTVTTTEYGAASLVLEIPRDAEAGDLWVFAVRYESDDDITEIISDAFTVVE